MIPKDKKTDKVIEDFSLMEIKLSHAGLEDSRVAAMLSIVLKLDEMIDAIYRLEQQIIYLRKGA